MKKYLLILLLGMVFINSCKKNEQFNFDENLIRLMSNEDIDSGLPSRYNSIIFFAKCNKDKIASTSMQELRGVYIGKYNEMTFYDYLTGVLNQKLDISYKDKIACFDLDKDITTIYEKKGLEIFLKTYTDKTVSGELVMKSAVEKNQINTIFYYFFINNYLVSYDDYIGKYYIRKTSSFYNK